MRGARVQVPGGRHEAPIAVPAAARLKGSTFRDWVRSVAPDLVTVPAVEPAASQADHTQAPAPEQSTAPANHHPAAATPAPEPDSPAEQPAIDLVANAALDAAPAEPAPLAHGPDLGALERQLKFLTTQLEILRSPCRAEALLAELREQLASISHAIEHLVPRRAFQVLEDEVRELGERLDAYRSSVPDRASFAALEEGLAEIRNSVRVLRPVELDQAVQTLLRKIDRVTEDGTDPLIFRQLDSAITALRDIVNQVASGDTLATLVREVRALGEKVEQTATGATGTAAASEGILLTLEKQINGIVDALARSAQADATAVPPVEPLVETIAEKLERFDLLDGRAALEPIRQHITELGEKIDRLQPLPPESVAFDRLEKRLDDLAAAVERVNRPGEDVPALAPLEQRIRGLAEKLERIEATSASHRALPSAPPAASFEPTAGLRESAQPAALAIANAPDREHAPLVFSAPEAAKQAALAPDAPLEPGSGPPRSRNTPGSADRPLAFQPIPAAERSDRSLAGPKFISAARRAAMAANEPPTPPASIAELPGYTVAGAVTRNLTARVKSLFVSTSVVLVALGAAGIVWSSADLLGNAGHRPPERVVAATQVEAVPPPAAEPPLASNTLPAPEATPGPVVAETPVPEPRPAAADDPPAKLAALGPAGAAAAPIKESARLPERLPPKNLDPDVTASIAPPPAVAAPPSAARSVPTPAPAPAKPAPEAGPGWSDPLPNAIATKSILAGVAERNPATAYEIALRYIEGRGVTTDPGSAAIWFARAAEGGMAIAQFRLGSMYEKGSGVKKNLSEARRLYLAAAAKGHATAMHNVAVLSAEGAEGRRDYASAAEWFQKAAEYGIADSQYNLAILYARGLGVERNFAEAFKWFTIAAEKGDPDAAQKRDEIAARLDAQTLAAAREAAAAFTPKPQPEEATATTVPARGPEEGAGKSKPHARAQGQHSARL